MYQISETAVEDLEYLLGELQYRLDRVSIYKETLTSRHLLDIQTRLKDIAASVVYVPEHS